MDYEPVKVSFGTSWEAMQIDRATGESIPPSRATENIIFIECSLQLRDYDQPFLAKGTISKNKLPKDELEKKTKAAILSLLKRGSLTDFFRPMEVTIDANGAEFDGSTGEAEIPVPTAELLFKQAQTSREAVKEWVEARDEISQNVDDYRYSGSKVRDALCFFEMCHEAANYGMMDAWCREKLSLIHLAMDRVASAKNPNHPAYVRAVNDIRGHLHHWPIQNSWHRHPPRRNRR